jgi:hypothetical protein
MSKSCRYGGNKDVTEARRRTIWKSPAWFALWALALGSCGQAGHRAIPCQTRDVIALATEHHRAHVPPEILKLSGGKLSYFFEDEGDSWRVVSPRGKLKLSTRLSIRKSDRKISVLD